MMTGFITYYGVPCGCPHCGASVMNYEAGMHIMWANQYGACVRIFCYRCDQWTDRAYIAELVDKVVPHPIPSLLYQGYIEHGGTKWPALEELTQREDPSS